MSLTTSQKAPVLDENGTQLTSTLYDFASDNPAVARHVDADLPLINLAGLSEGFATVTATRKSDSVTADLEVEVTAAPFSISLGAPVPR